MGWQGFEVQNKTRALQNPSIGAQEIGRWMPEHAESSNGTASLSLSCDWSSGGQHLCKDRECAIQVPLPYRQTMSRNHHLTDHPHPQWNGVRALCHGRVCTPAKKSDINVCVLEISFQKNDIAATYTKYFSGNNFPKIALRAVDRDSENCMDKTLFWTCFLGKAQFSYINTVFELCSQSLLAGVSFRTEQSAHRKFEPDIPADIRSQTSVSLRCFPLEPFFEINPGILCSGIGS